MTLFHTDVKLDPEVKRLWLEALRSGHYQQGREVLRTSDGRYCCYGVATDLAVKAGKTEWIDSRFTSGQQSHDSAMPGEKVRQWLFPKGTGVEFAWPSFPVIDQEDGGEGLGVSPAHLNDHGLTFSQIADLIDFWW